MKFKVLFPDGSGIDQNTLVNGVKIQDERTLCRVIKSAWKQWSNSTSFQNWADTLNNDPNYMPEFTKIDALDNLCSNYHLEFNGKAVDLFDFFREFHPPVQLKKPIPC